MLDYSGEATEAAWHTDVTFSPTPPMASILRMERCATRGGDTIFTNQHLAYEQLSPAIRALVDGLTAIHSAALYGHYEIQAEHPMVRVHPETGRRSLFVNRGFTSYCPQLRPGESDALLEHLYSWSEQPRFQCRYQWQHGAIGIWDNRCTQHYAVPDYDSQRTIQRVTVLGDRPRGTGPTLPHIDADPAEVKQSRSAAVRGIPPRLIDVENNSLQGRR